MTDRSHASRDASAAAPPVVPAGRARGPDGQSALRSSVDVPDFSPAMLRLHLHARCRYAHALAPGRCGYQATAKRERDRLRRMAGVTAFQMDFAWMGRLRSAAARTRLWAGLGHFPGDFGIVLADDGGQRLG